MTLFQSDDVALHFLDEGPRDGPVVVFANSLGTDLHIWDQVLLNLPQGLRVIRYDKRGHGESGQPPAPYTMGALITDLERLLDHLMVKDALVVGLSIGGLIAQGLATKRLDLVRAVVLSNTAAKIGTKDMWNDRIAAIQANGLASTADMVMERWFSKAFRKGDQIDTWRHKFLQTPQDGYVGCCAAIAGTDFITPTSGLRLPALAIAGSEDGATPPDMVRELADLIPGSDFKLIRGAGHLPCVEKPREYAEILSAFLARIGHLA